jgi:hypothetical protein
VLVDGGPEAGRRFELRDGSINTTSAENGESGIGALRINVTEGMGVREAFSADWDYEDI